MIECGQFGLPYYISSMQPKAALRMTDQLQEQVICKYQYADIKTGELHAP